MMRAFSDLCSSRRLMRLLAAPALLAAFLAGAAVQTVWAHDQRLDDILALVEKGRVLAQAAIEDGVPTLPEKVGHAVEKHLVKAIDDLNDAYDEVLAAIALEDSVP